MKNESKLILIGLDGIIDTNSHDKYTYKDWIVENFRIAFDSDTKHMSDEDILIKSDKFGYTGLLHTLVSEDPDYEIKIKYYIDYVLNKEVCDQDSIEKFISCGKKLYSKIVKYDDIVTYIENLNKACNIGVITDRCWYGCTSISSIITVGKYSYGQFSYMTRLPKLMKEAWELAERSTGIDRDDILIIDTNKDVIQLTSDMGFNTHLHTEGDKTNLSIAVNAFLSK